MLRRSVHRWCNATYRHLCKFGRWRRFDGALYLARRDASEWTSIARGGHMHGVCRPAQLAM